MKILFIRHGEPDYKHDSLTQKGFKEAKILADYLETIEVRDYYCSPLGRAKATASDTLKRLNREATIYDWLREFPGYIIDEQTKEHRIPWDLMPAAWTNQPFIYDKDKWLQSPLMASGDIKDKYFNVTKNMDTLLASYGYHRNQNYYKCSEGNQDTIVIFCHFGVICVILSHLLGIAAPALWHGFYVAPASITTIVTEERVKGEVYFRCQGVGDTSHLYAANEPASTAGFFQEVYGAPFWQKTV
ncbi:MAG: histidine phosphatase family protein [Clostridiales bacterium]|nr:histidine phosphatase family protein [Clostridiales bacterium]